MRATCCELICFARKRNLDARLRQNNTTANHSKPVQSFAQKYSAFVLTQISRITPPVSRRMRGARERHERAVGCGGRRWRDRRTRLTRTAKSCGSGAAVLALSPREAKLLGGDGGKKAVLREEHEVSRKAIAQGRPECSRCPVCSCALLFAQIARETAGAASTRSSLRPLNKRAGSSSANLGRNAPRERVGVSTL
jgi:hypothetical protein